MSVLPKFF